MALFHLSVTQTKRSAGQSAIASAALAGVVAVFAVILAIQSLPGTVGGRNAPIVFAIWTARLRALPRRSKISHAQK